MSPFQTSTSAISHRCYRGQTSRDHRAYPKRTPVSPSNWEGRVTVLEDFLRHDIKADNFLVVLGRKASQVSAIHAHLQAAALAVKEMRGGVLWPHLPLRDNTSPIFLRHGAGSHASGDCAIFLTISPDNVTTPARGRGDGSYRFGSWMDSLLRVEPIMTYGA
ncbi:uncharacterized protein [Triticum aestivum]|uniref:uncharacterized protein isoform X1 n=1 Tax=Triticum aestivum TaxID=4565 RepID=UPI001D01B710|nr:uncharacterized protein LOC123108164 isoform X1 [Triticum aestivum]XP_044385944.1 uncharacterized protein LOC123108164 isoform X1 [Triticum aestivum]